MSDSTGNVSVRPGMSGIRSIQTCTIVYSSEHVEKMSVAQEADEASNQSKDGIFVSRHWKHTQ